MAVAPRLGHTTDTQNTYEFQNYTSVIRGVHAWRFGVRLRGATDANSSPQNFGGTFTFSGGLAPELDANNMPVLDASGQPVLVNISSIESYRRTLLFQQMGLPASQIRQLGGGASQFSINAGNPLVSGSQFDMGAFVGDDWKVRPNLTLNLGLRYETQTNIHDWRDFAPRIGARVGARRGLRKVAAQERDPRRIRHVLRPLQPGEHSYRGALQRPRSAAVHRCESGFLPHGSDSLLADRGLFRPARFKRSAPRCALRISCSPRSALNARCRSTRPSRSPMQTRTGSTCCVLKTSMPRCQGPIYRPFQTVARFPSADRVKFS